jgi:hypothetical protein
LRSDRQLRWLHKVRLYPTCAQEHMLVEMLRVSRELYNATLQQRRDSWTHVEFHTRQNSNTPR